MSSQLGLCFSHFIAAGKFHVEQDPQFALVHLQFVHWADKLLKVIYFVGDTAFGTDDNEECFATGYLVPHA
jgi:hypothetical protein